MASDEYSAISWLLPYSHGIISLSLSLLSNLTFIVWFWCILVWISLFGVHLDAWICQVLSSAKFEKFSTVISFECFSILIPSFLPFWNFSDMNVRSFFIVAQVPEVFSFFSLFLSFIVHGYFLLFDHLVGCFFLCHFHASVKPVNWVFLIAVLVFFSSKIYIW